MASRTHSTDSRDEAPQPGDGVDISAPRARQAYPGRRILWILLASLAAVILAFVISYATKPAPPATVNPGNARITNPADAQLFNAPEPAPKQPG